MFKKIILLSSAASILIPTQLRADQAFSDNQVKSVQSIVKEYIINNPEIITQSLSVLQKRQQAEMAAKAQKAIKENHKEIFDSADDVILGNPKGSMQLVMFVDPYCGHCHEFSKIVDQVIPLYPELKVIVKDFPVFGQPSVDAVKTLKRAQLQGKYKEMLALISEKKEAQTPEQLMDLVSKVKGLDAKPFAKGDQDAKLGKIVNSTLELGQKIGINATPSLIYKDQLITGGMPLENLKKLLDAKG